MNFSSTLKFLCYLTITLNVLHDGMANIRCDYQSAKIHEDFYNVIDSVSKEKKYFYFFQCCILTYIS